MEIFIFVQYLFSQKPKFFDILPFLIWAEYRPFLS